jgi:anti-sigma regulatory factor (Ser/Thr protein kinase)
MIVPSEGETGGAEAMRFPVRPEAATMARTAIQDVLPSVSPSVVSDAQLLTSELVSNAVRHAGLGPEDTVGLTVSFTPDRLHVGVLDNGPGFEAAAHRPDAVGGWGLLLVETLSDRWGVIRGQRTNEVWFEIDL